MISALSSRDAIEGLQSGPDDEDILLGGVLADLVLQHGQVEEIAGPNAAPGGLVFVGRADSPAGGSDLPFAQRVFADPLHQAVIRQDEVGVAADDDLLVAEIDDLAERGQLVQEGPGVEHDAVADDAQRPGTEDAGGDQVQDDLGPVAVDGMAGVVAALVAGHGVEGGRQQVDDLALAFISPLGSEDDDVGHGLPLKNGRPPGRGERCPSG